MKKWNIDSLISEGIILAFLSAWAYLITFNYESGFLSYFGLSPRLIVIEISSILISLVALFGLVMFIFVTGYELFNDKNLKNLIRRELTIVGLCGLLLVVTPFYLFGFSQKSLPYLLGFVTLLLFVFIPPFWEKGRTYEEKLIKNLKKKSKQKPSDNAFNWLHERLGSKWFLVFMFFLFSLIFSKNAGLSLAMKQQNFYVIDGEPELIIVTIYGDRILAMPIDRENNTIIHELYILSTDTISDDYKAIRIEYFGELMLEEA